VAGGVVVTLLIGALATPNAMAQSLTVTASQHGDRATNVQQVVGGGDNPSPASTSEGPGASTSPGSSLPFTGMDVGIVLAVALALLASGSGIRRAARLRSTIVCEPAITDQTGCRS
jgi:hypothetical protein